MNDPLAVSCEEWCEVAKENPQAIEVITAALAEIGENDCFSDTEEITDN